MLLGFIGNAGGASKKTKLIMRTEIIKSGQREY